MYKARIETEAGKIVRLDYDSGVIFDIDPLSGVDVDLATSQGFQQIGETVEHQSVAGVSRTINGVFITADAERRAQAMLRALPMFTTGRLIYDDRYFCNIHVRKTPYIRREKSGRIIFSMMLYCETPYWLYLTDSSYVMGGYTPAFRLPVVYDSHRYGIKNTSMFTNCINHGTVEVPFAARFTCDTPVTNPGLINVYTLEKIRINAVLQNGSVIEAGWKNGRLYLTQDGEDIFSALDAESDLFVMRPGDNVLRMTADDNLEGLSVSVTYNAVEVGVI